MVVDHNTNIFPLYDLLQFEPIYMVLVFGSKLTPQYWYLPFVSLYVQFKYEFIYMFFGRRFNLQYRYYAFVWPV